MTSPDLHGTPVSPGIGYGPVLTLAAAVPVPPEGERHTGDADAELARATAALAATADTLDARGEQAGGPARDVLAAQALMARDPSLADDVAARIRKGSAAPRAVYDAFGAFRDLLASAGEYLAGRVADLDDVRDRTIADLLGVPMPGVPEGADPFVLAARDLAPADTALLDPARVLAFVTEQGGPTSHTAIIARAMGVPAVVACPGAADLATGTLVLVDGATGLVRPDPDPAEAERARAAGLALRAAAAETTGPGRTSDGREVPLLANVGGPKDVPKAVENGAQGVGLYRTEFLFLDRATAPSDDEQVEAYARVLNAFPGGKVVVRVLDAGADKPLAFLPAPDTEPNPALGVRGARMLERHPDVLDGQLRALARAASGASAKLAVMAPMITDADETRRFVAACRAAGLDGEAGVMVEVPAAALRAADLAAEADFFSIGTNDLTQYACAADREVGALNRLQDPWRPAVLDLVALTASGAGGKSVGVCGEAAADPVLACVLVGLGVTSLSMGAASLPLVRVALARHTYDQCVRAAAAARAATTPETARTAARAELPATAELGL
ncbi:MAG TPA: phosphoenolpyruvate--protein phosphotransferase [Streptosporangiaceae bacterium]|jgi:phosphotransferase system enzyme I (PtsI)